MEVAVQFDRFIQKCYESKLMKYLELWDAINDLEVYCRIIVLVVGALGFVLGKFVNGLKILGLNR